MKNDYGVLLPYCSACGKIPDAGVAAGIHLKRRFICSECEQKLVENKLSESCYGNLVKGFHNISG